MPSKVISTEFTRTISVRGTACAWPRDVLRELLPLLHLDSSAGRKLCRKLREVTSELGVLRTLDVLVLLIDELERDRRYSATALRQVGRAISAARTESRQLLASTLPIKKFGT